MESTRLIYRSTDGCGNSINVTQKLIRTVDTQKPTASNPADLVISGCNGRSEERRVGKEGDAGDKWGSPVVAFVSDGAPSLVGCTETTVRTYSVTDGCGNSINVTQKLIRTVDTQKPTASNPADLVISGCNGTFPRPNISVVADATDSCGNVASQDVTVKVDGTPPQLTIDTTALTSACYANEGDAKAAVQSKSSALDTCDGPITPIVTVKSGTSTCSVTFNITATDS